MGTGFHGYPCWYELTAPRGGLDRAGDFYAGLMGWSVQDSGMPGFDYRLAASGGDKVAGLMEMPADVPDMPPFWLTYFAVDDTDRFVADARAAGASVHRAPFDIAGTGRLAILGDPQGAAFGILQPDTSAMSEAEIADAKAGGGAFDSGQPGRCNWNELMSTDPQAALDFYTRLFGWTPGEAMDMGDDGTYQLVQRAGLDIGAIMGLGAAPRPTWLAYFGVAGSVSASIDAIKAAGGRVAHGPMEVPGGDFIAVAQDPQGAWFAVAGPER